MTNSSHPNDPTDSTEFTQVLVIHWVYSSPAPPRKLFAYPSQRSRISNEIMTSCGWLLLADLYPLSAEPAIEQFIARRQSLGREMFQFNKEISYDSESIRARFFKQNPPNPTGV